MKERPILFNAPMIKAILDGRKTQTRRIFKVPRNVDSGHFGFASRGMKQTPAELVHWPADDAETKMIHCPYGAPGDRLWVRERQLVIARGHSNRHVDQIRVRYLADDAESGLLPYPDRLKGKPEIGKCLSYGGYRESSRITLAVTSVRVERLQEISEEDARAEGAIPCDWQGAEPPPCREIFGALWDAINGKRASWASNPWVWVVSFSRVTP